MTKRLKLFLVILFGSIAIACCAAGCSTSEPTKEDMLSKFNGGQVTYYANGGCFNENTSIVIRDIYFKKADVPFFNITEPKSSIYVRYAGYEFLGWYLPETYPAGDPHAGQIMYTYTYKDATSGEYVTVPAYPKLKEDGTPVLDTSEARPIFYIEGSDEEILERKIQVVPSDTLVDENYIVKADDQFIVCAKWEAALRFVYKLAAEEGVEYEDDNGNIYHHGDVIYEKNFGTEPTSSAGNSVPVTLKDMTFVSIYEDEQCTEFVAESYNKAYYDEKEIGEIVVWVKYISGKWKIVKDTKSVTSMFSGLGTSSNKYYLLTDIDCKNISKLTMPVTTNAQIEGNGHTLSNLNFSDNSLKNNDKLGAVFGNISASAQIKNLKLSNININVTCNGDMDFYAVCLSAADGAVLENLTVENITANVKLPGMVKNAQNDSRTSWIFGGMSSDEAFLQKYSSVAVTGENTLTITK